MRRRALIEAAMAVALCASVPGQASAQARPLVSLEVDPCIEVDQRTVRHLVEIELRMTLAERPSPDLTRLAARCDDQGVFLVVDDPVTGQSLTRRTSVRDEPASARARLLALAGVELVAASWSELSDRPGGGEVDVASAVARRSAIVYIERRGEPAQPTTILAIEGALRVHDAHFLSFGAGAFARVRLGPALTAAADVLVEHLAGDNAFATAGVTRLTCAPRLGLRAVLEDLELEAAVGFRLGAVFLSESPMLSRGAGPASQTALWGGPMVALASSYGRRVVLGFVIEVGYALAAKDAELGGRTIVTLDGWWLLGTASLGFSL